MASKNRAALINKVLKVVKKHFKPVPPARERTLLDHLLLACCLENSLYDAADRVFQTLTTDYFDWNEVRVSTVRELSEVCKPLNDPAAAATRLKRILQSVFETHYSFDLEPLKKQNIGQAVRQFEKYNGSTPFVVAYVTQQALGGHSIPVNKGLLESLRIVGVVTDAEAAKGQVPGLERTVPKSKGAEVGSQLHQLGVEMHRSPYGPVIRKLLLDIEPDAKDRLPKRPTAKPAEAIVADGHATRKAGAAKAAPAPAPVAKQPEISAKKAAKKAAEAESLAGATSPKKSKRPAPKKATASAAAAAGKRSTATKRLAKRKPK